LRTVEDDLRPLNFGFLKVSPQQDMRSVPDREAKLRSMFMVLCIVSESEALNVRDLVESSMHSKCFNVLILKV